MSTSQLKPVLDNLQNNATSTSSQIKGKKRERGDQSSDPLKREGSSKTDDSDSNLARIENLTRSETPNPTEKGALPGLMRPEAANPTEMLGLESVEKLIKFIQPNRVDKKLDLVSRSMVAGVIAATDRFPCLSYFVHLKGLVVLDEWLQDVHKGRIGEVSGSKDGEKPIEEFLLVLLRALDKLPVNLHALQTCNIGRSVNRLRSHRNLDIQRKARSLVDIWKKRVEIEMNVIDAKSGPNQVSTWPSKSSLAQVHGGRNSNGSCDVSLKNSVTQHSESKTDLNKASIGETTAKSISSPSGPVKSTLSVPEDSRLLTVPNCGSDVPIPGRDDKSSGSAMSHNSSHSFSGQEETRVTAGLTNANKISSGGSRHRKSTNGVFGTLVSPKETMVRNPSVSRNAADEKLQPCTLPCEKTLEVPVVETSSHKLIVKIPNRIEPERGSPAQSASGGSFDDPSVMSSRASSPVLSDIRESDHSLKEKTENHQTNSAPGAYVEPGLGNDLKDLQVESDEQREVSAAPNEAQSKNDDGNWSASEKSEVPCSSLGNCLKDIQWRETSGSALNALIESCVKYSEGNAHTCGGDDVGMNLLASVATREMGSEIVSPADTLHGNTCPDDENILHDSKSKPSSGDDHIADRCLTNDVNEKQMTSAPILGSNEKINLSKQASLESCGDRKSHSYLSEESKKVTTDCTEIDGKSDQLIGSKVEDCVPDTKATLTGPSLIGVKKSNVLSNAEGKQQVETTPSILSAAAYHKRDIAADSNSAAHVEAKPEAITDSEPVESCISGKEGTKNDQKSGEADEICAAGGFIQSEEHKSDFRRRGMSASEDDSLFVGLGADANENKGECVKVNAKSEMVVESHVVLSHDVDGRGKLKKPKLTDTGGDKMEETMSTVVVGGSLSASGPADMVAKMDFDLNEGLSGNDGKCGELGHSGCLPYPNEVEPLLMPVSLGCTSIPASITVAAAAKGPFVPPVHLLRNKGELGWKGSATTSAFRPVEPRKFPQLATGHSNVSTSDDCTSKPCRVLFDFDLNVADETLLEDMACQDSSADIHSKAENLKYDNDPRNNVNGPSPPSHSGGLDLDLNLVDDTNNMPQYSTSSCHTLSTPVVPVKSFLPTTSETRRGFDLNSGPGADDLATEQPALNPLGGVGTLSMNPSLPVSGIRPYNLEARNFSAWLPPGSSYSSVAIPSFLPERGEQPFPVVAPIAPQRILGPSGGGPFTPDMYRGYFLSPTPAVSFPSGPFPYQMFPFGSTPPLPSGSFAVGSASTSGGRHFNPALNSQFLAPVSEVSSQHLKPYMIGLHDGSNNGGLENCRKWSRQGFDLNAGPGAPEVEGREDFVVQRQSYISGSQAVAEEQGRIYPLADGALKRKEPEAGSDRESFRYKQSSWQ